MYLILDETFLPYEYDDIEDVYCHIRDCCNDLKNALRFVEKDEGHLVVRCPVSGKYLAIDADTKLEIDNLDKLLRKRNLYRP